MWRGCSVFFRHGDRDESVSSLGQKLDLDPDRSKLGSPLAQFDRQRPRGLGQIGRPIGARLLKDVKNPQQLLHGSPKDRAANRQVDHGRRVEDVSPDRWAVGVVFTTRRVVRRFRSIACPFPLSFSPPFPPDVSSQGGDHTKCEDSRRRESLTVSRRTPVSFPRYLKLLFSLFGEQRYSGRAVRTGSELEHDITFLVHESYSRDSGRVSGEHKAGPAPTIPESNGGPVFGLGFQHELVPRIRIEETYKWCVGSVNADHNPRGARAVQKF
jgi:hypothetical protein